MITIIRRTLIVLALSTLVYLWLDGPGSVGEKTEVTSRWSSAERVERLNATIEKRWNARSTGDWVTVYELFSPDFRQKSSLAQFMQNKDKFYFKNWQLLDASDEENSAVVTIQYDWGLNLPMKIDLGEPFKEGVVIKERYEFHEETGDWYFKGNVVPKNMKM